MDDKQLDEWESDRDKLRERIDSQRKSAHGALWTRANVTVPEIRALLDALDEAEQEVEHWINLALVDAGANPVVGWKERALEAERKLAKAHEQMSKLVTGPVP